jgi:hypothetical protein
MKFFKTTLLVGVLSINMAAPVFANQAPITEPIQQFTAADTQSLFEQDAKPMQLAALSQTEMKETEGAVAPLVAVGIMTAGRFIIQRYVAPRLATSIVRSGGSVLAATRQQAASIARAAGNGSKPIREFHPGPGARYTHYHTNPRNGGHVWYGSPR